MFMRGEKCELRVLDPTDPHQVTSYTNAVNAGWTTEHLFTGSIPMRPFDVAERWRNEIHSGDILFGVWCPHWVGKSTPYTSHQEFVGTVSLHSTKPIYRSWEARWIIFDPNSVGRGIGTEAGRMMVDYAFRRLNAWKVWLGVSADNDRAIGCYRKIGFTEEGRLRDEVYAQGRYHDAIRMSILRPEWETLCANWGVQKEGRVQWYVTAPSSSAPAGSA